MAFIRTKRIKKKSGNVYTYAYLVENKWKKRAKGKQKSRQKVKAYLGRVYNLEMKNEADFFAWRTIELAEHEKYVRENSVKDLIIDLVKFELYKHGFDDVGNFVSNGDIFLDLTNNNISFVDKCISKEGIVLGINEGFLCKETINGLINFYAEGTEEELGYKYAKAFVEAGITVPKEIFIGLFGKVFKLAN